MKKIIGIIGVTLIVAVTFFNISFITDTNGDINLASLIQTANADGEYEPGYYDEVKNGTFHWEDAIDENCIQITGGYGVDCLGVGPLVCQDLLVITYSLVQCQ